MNYDLLATGCLGILLLVEIADVKLKARRIRFLEELNETQKALNEFQKTKIATLEVRLYNATHRFSECDSK